MAITHKPLSPPLIQYRIGDIKLVSAGDVVKKFTFSRDILTGADRHRIEIIAPRFQGINLARIHREVPLVFRFGYAGGPVSEVIKHRMIDFDIDISSDGTIISITGGDSSLLVNRGTRNKGYLGKKISEIVEELARENRLKFDIEETKGTYTLRQVWKSDMQFIKQILLPRAVSARSGRADYDCFFEGNVLHFHPPRYTNEVYKKYVLASGEGSHKIKRFHLSFRGELSNAQGGLISRVDGYNPFTKEPLSFTATDENTEKEILGPKTILMDSPTRESRYYTQAAHSDFEVENEAKARWMKAHRARYSGWMEVEGDPLLKDGDTLAISVPADDKSNYVISGRYLMQGVTHVISNKTYQSIISIVRNGILDGEHELQGTKRKNLRERDSRVVKQRVREID